MAQPAQKQLTQATPSVAEGLLQPYEKLPLLNKSLLPKLRKLCGERYIDLLLHLPRGVLDRSYTPTIESAESARLATIRVRVLSYKVPPRRGRGGWGTPPHKITVSDDSGKLELLFFNGGTWLQRVFVVGEDVIISGLIERRERALPRMVHPEVFSGRRSLADVATSVPVYPLTQGISRNMLGNIIKQVAERAQVHGTALPRWLPEGFAENHGWPDFITALASLHNVDDEQVLNPAHPARARVVFDELLAMQIALVQARQRSQNVRGIAQPAAGELVQKFVQKLPFTLTGDQQQAVDDIFADMAITRPMLRLVQGDVGSGKTVVAFMALLRAVENGRQGILMAPTEILATQHYEGARKLFAPFGLSVALLTGRLSAAQKRKLKESIAGGHIQIIIGTHALIHDVMFHQPGVVVVDEQHRFGVQQRLSLIGAEGEVHLDVLVMTATPIPRTLALTFYGDMDVSIIREKPPGRQPIETIALHRDRLPEIVHSLKRLQERGLQAYWVCPLVEENEESDLTAATARYNDLRQHYGDTVGLLHGKMKGSDKEAVLQDFRDGKLNILVSTTVVEVGVDVPLATVMVIEHAERFGLAQLHQLRGRVGRSSQSPDGAPRKDTCILLFEKLSEVAQERLEAMRHSEDGFELAEKDLQLRGPGEILGTRQSGQVVTRLADLAHHKDMLPLARNVAEDLLARRLSAQQYGAIEWLLRVFRKDDAARLLKAG